LQKFLSKKFSEQIDKIFDVSFSSTTFLFFFAFSGCFLSDEHSKTLKKKCKKIVSNSFFKQIDKKSKTDCFSISLSHFGHFSVRGVQKHDKKTDKKNITSPKGSPWRVRGRGEGRGGRELDLQLLWPASPSPCSRL
jgi:hypothetical protein